MEQSVAGKKLLIMGGRPAATPDIVRAAKRMGVYTIVTDNVPPERSPAKLMADEYWEISTAEVERLAERVRDEGVDGIFIGPFDLSIALGIPGRFDDARHIAAVERVRLACERAGKPCIMFCGSGEAAAGYFKQGFDSVTVGLDIAMLIDAARGVTAAAFGK